MASNQQWSEIEGHAKVNKKYSNRSIPDIAAGTPLMEESNQKILEEVNKAKKLEAKYFTNRFVKVIV